MLLVCTTYIPILGAGWNASHSDLLFSVARCGTGVALVWQWCGTWMPHHCHTSATPNLPMPHQCRTSATPTAHVPHRGQTQIIFKIWLRKIITMFPNYNPTKYDNLIPTLSMNAALCTGPLITGSSREGNSGQESWSDSRYFACLQRLRPFRVVWFDHFSTNWVLKNYKIKTKTETKNTLFSVWKTLSEYFWKCVQSNIALHRICNIYLIIYIFCVSANKSPNLNKKWKL